MAEEKVTDEQMAYDLLSMLAAFDIEPLRAKAITRAAYYIIRFMPDEEYKQLGTGVSLFMGLADGNKQ